MESLTVTNGKAARSFPEFISDEFLAALRAAGVVEAFVFGSVVHGTATESSDIDILVRFGADASVFAQLDLITELTEISGRSVDVLTNIHPAFAEYIEPTLVPLVL